METKYFFTFYALFLSIVVALPEQGIWKAKYAQKDNMHAFTRSLYKNTKVKVSVHCNTDMVLKISWILRRSPCANEYETIESDHATQYYYLTTPEILPIQQLTYKTVEYVKGSISMTCGDEHDLSSDHVKFKAVDTIPYVNATAYLTQRTGAALQAPLAKDTKGPPGVEKKDTEGANKKTKREEPKATTTIVPVPVPTTTVIKKEEDDYLVEAWLDGYFVFVLKMDNSTPIKANVTVEFKSTHGYIGAVEWPLLVFFGVMGLFYAILSLLWLVMLACNWRDLLRVQFWIGGVLVLGMLEAAVFFGEYENISKTGVSVRGAVIFAELVSALKRTLARMLVIVVSLGFGIVKPRLGQTFHKVLCAGGLYFILSAVEGCIRTVKKTGSPKKDDLIALVPLAVVDASICWWIFSALVQTTRTLRLRRNIVKLSLYRHFTNTLIFAVLVSIGFMIWSISQHRMKICLTDWKELWVDVAFWHLLFFLILFIIMILWRPSSNNQRYAFSPLLDAADDEEDENVMHDAFEGMKMRGTKSQANGSPLQKDSKAEDDLKWVEDNIPSSIADKALPSLLDSDEEIMTTKFEMSKME